MISFSKWSDSGDALAGAKMSLEGTIGENPESNYKYAADVENIAEGEYFISGDIITWVTDGTDFIITGLEGKYTLAESEAPEGYEKISDNVTFEVANGVIIPDDRVTTDEVKILASSVSVSDKKIPEIEVITISKQDVNDGIKELAGAEMKLSGVDLEGKTIEISESMIGGEFNKDDASVENNKFENGNPDFIQ